MPQFTVAWPSGEFGGMGLEGSVKLGMRKELLEVKNLDERRALYDKLVAAQYEAGKALRYAEIFEVLASIRVREGDR